MMWIREIANCGRRKPSLCFLLFIGLLLFATKLVIAEGSTCLHRYTEQLKYNTNCNPFENSLMRLECKAEVPLNATDITIGWFLNCDELEDGMMIDNARVLIEPQVDPAANVRRLRSRLTINDLSDAFAGDYTCNLLGNNEYIPSDKFHLDESMDFDYGALGPCVDGYVLSVSGAEKCADITENMTIPVSLICEDTPSTSSHTAPTSIPIILKTVSLIHASSSTSSTSSVPAVISPTNPPTTPAPSVGVPSPSEEETTSPSSTQDPTSVWLYVVVAVAAVFFMIIIVLAIVCVGMCIHRTKNLEPQTPTSTTDLEKFSKSYKRRYPYKNSYCHNAIQRELPKIPVQTPQQNHIEQLKEELEHKDMLFLKHHITLTKVIGEGESGLVYRGYIRGTECVAIKTGKALISEFQKERLLKEVSLMMTFEHPNVMPLVGMCFDREVPLLIMPFMSNGSVLDYVRKNENILICTETSSLSQRLDAKKKCMDMCHQIAKGMSYLAMKKLVHRDLAARNCMIDGLTKGVIKVADFGMAEDMYSTNYYKYDSEGREERVPLKWMAPETIKNNTFSESSDVWSYGVTCWEVFTCGRVPYSGVPVMTLLSELHSGQRLDQPSNAACSDAMWDLIKSCWSIDCEERPTFNDIVKETADLLDCDSSYMKL